MTRTFPSVLDARFPLIQGAIPSLETNLLSPHEEREERVGAAVSLVLRSGPELELLLIKRAKSEGDPWSGDMALPGGRRDESDSDLLNTAMRETLEESGLDLQSVATPLGALDTLSPTYYRVPPMTISPFVFGVPEGTEARVASREVEEVLWASLPYLGTPAAHGSVELPLGKERRTFPCFRVEERVVWGLTYRILTNFLKFLEGSSVLDPSSRVV